LLEHVSTLSRQGKIEEARAEAANALRWAQASTVSARDLGNVLRQVADLEYQAGLSEAAEKHYRAALETFGARPEASGEDASEVLNNLAVLCLLRGDPSAAEARLSQAFSGFARPGLAFARLSNNRGVLAELQGDWKRAADLYTQSLNAFAALLGSGDERRLVEKNLARIKSSR
jgi:tetratricopeptide (TPR) repeat protein